MSFQENNLDDDLGIESFQDVYNAKFQPQQDRGIVEKIGETGVLGVVGTKEGRRQVGRTAARIGETISGLPGDVKELFNNIMIGVPEYFAGEELPRWRQMVEGTPDGTIGGFGLGEPTSEEVREGITKELTGEELEPQNEYERFGDEIAKDFATLALPVKGRVPFARALGSSILANSGAEIAKPFVGEKGAALTKMGLLFTSGLLGQEGGGARQYIRNLYKDMEKSVPEGAAVNATNLEKKLSQIESVLKKGDPGDASKVQSFQKINAIRDKIQSGQINVDEALALTQSTNESIYGLGDLKRGQNQLYNIRDALHKTVGEYGAENKDFIGKWKSANEAYAATETSRKVGNWIKKNIRPKDYIYAASALGLEGYLTGLPRTAATLGGVAGLGATAYTAEVLKRIAQSPALRTHYLNVVKNSLNQNTPSFLRAMRQLDDGLKKSFDEEPYETVEFND